MEQFSHGLAVAFFMEPEFCIDVDRSRKVCRFDRDVNPPNGWCKKSFAQEACFQLR